MKRIIAIIGAVVITSVAAQAQVLLSSGLTYSQNFDTFATSSSSVSGTMSWTDNSTLLGWYARRTATTSSGPYGSFTYATLRVSIGTDNNGSVYDYGSVSSTDRAMGSIGSGTIKSNAFGVEIKNDRAVAVNLDSISYNGEQWRLGQGNISSTNYLWFFYRTSSSPIIDPEPLPTSTWTPFNALTFTNRVFATATSDAGVALDGNANSVAISSTLTGVTLNPGDEVFLRWVDPDEAGNDMGMAIDNVQVTFSEVPEPSTAVLGGLAFFGLIAWRRFRS
jgi:hypothetical protein